VLGSKLISLITCGYLDRGLLVTLLAEGDSLAGVAEVVLNVSLVVRVLASTLLASATVEFRSSAEACDRAEVPPELAGGIDLGLT
jgi:hypothetical protein